jgi:uncharacterized membrane protein YczE
MLTKRKLHQIEANDHMDVNFQSKFHRSIQFSRDSVALLVVVVGSNLIVNFPLHDTGKSFSRSSPN